MKFLVQACITVVALLFGASVAAEASSPQCKGNMNMKKCIQNEFCCNPFTTWECSTVDPKTQKKPFIDLQSASTIAESGRCYFYDTHGKLDLKAKTGRALCTDHQDQGIHSHWIVDVWIEMSTETGSQTQTRVVTGIYKAIYKRQACVIQNDASAQ